ncbi:MAG: NADH-quinone oxidoreductase subunit J family protein [Phycisphaerales bacterium]
MLAQPILLYAGVALGALGVLLMLPREGVSPRGLGGIIALIAFALAMLGLSLSAVDARPNLLFYVFGLIALFGGTRMISHPRPVYAALFFILTILAGCGLFLLLSAEFMAFALVIIYAGAILITYLFVIMLATEAPSEEQVERLSIYDRFAREPVAAILAGFVLLTAMIGLINKGVAEAGPGIPGIDAPSYAAVMPKKLDTAFREAGLNDQWEIVGVEGDAVRLKGVVGAAVPADLEHLLVERQDTEILLRLPETFIVQDIERVGYALVGKHPLGLELAGIILLMAMLGAVVLARKQIEIEEEKKMHALGRLGGEA